MTDKINQKALARAISHGDKNAYEQVFRIYYDSLCSYAYSLLKDRHRAEDVVQSIFLRIWEQRDEKPLPDYLKNYLYRAVHNEAVNILQHHQVVNDSQKTVEARYAEWKDSTADDSNVTDKQGAKLKKAIAGLPERTRETFVLCRQEGLTYKETAQVMGVSHKTVEAQMGRALKKLREYLIVLLPPLIVLGFLMA